MLAAILEIAARTNVIVFDPQSDRVLLPPRIAADTVGNCAASHPEAARRAGEGMKFAARARRTASRPA
jgi:hypothetical protein